MRREVPPVPFGMAIFRGAYDPTGKRNALMKTLPGCRPAYHFWEYAWAVPKEFVSIIARAAKAKYEVIHKPRLEVPTAPDWLFPYQQEAYERWAQDGGAHIFSSEMGLGKTPTAIACIDAVNAKAAVVIAPAGVHSTWIDELEKHSDPDRAVVLNEAPRPDGPYVRICSWAQLDVLDPEEAPDIIVIDELHYALRFSSNRSQLLTNYMRHHWRVPRVGLSATIEGERSVTDSYNILNTIYTGEPTGDPEWPFSLGRFGGFNKFGERYAHKMPDEHANKGYIFSGINDEHRDELLERLEVAVHRATWEDNENACPAPEISYRRMDADATATRLAKKWLANTKEEALANDAIRYDAMNKASAAAEYAKTLDGPVLVLTWLQETAEKGAELTGSKFVHGELSMKKREAAIETAINDKKILWATIASTKEGINTLIRFKHVIYAELTYERRAFIQSLGRFRRAIPNITPPDILLLIRARSIDEVILNRLVQKEQRAQKMIKAGSLAKAFLKAVREEKDADWKARLAASLEGYGEDDEDY